MIKQNVINYLRPNSIRQLLMYIIIILMGVGVFLTRYDAPLYQNHIVGVVETATQQSKQKTTDQFNNVDYSITQVLRIKILNGDRHGQKVKVKNNYFKSGGLNQAYRPGQQLFLNHEAGNDISIIGQKRDTLVALMAWITVSLLLMLMRLPGLMTLISVIINVTLLYLAIKLDLNVTNINVVFLFSSVGILMAFVTLSLALGWNKKMAITLTATLLSSVVALIIANIVMSLTHQRGLEFELMDYITQLPQPIFLAEAFLAALGAIMDASTDIIATQFEIQEAHPEVSRRNLFNAGLGVGRSIMGALTSVLFLIFISETFAMSLLYLRNGNTWGYTIEINMVLGMVQTTIAGIGIVLAVPIASGLAAFFIRNKEVA
ncbi:YibE/F family protein [Periweissella fabalis]|uniref:YibE/F family protein n=1 Tax=Periweissella fabalis TaxID=1070421 RepID=A0A7X6S3T7_9LACO|nr:YibE/F family protein [Periweissella fabalis]MCM0598619.1 YibE/F family protein [Periweissella fabalis]NKZ24272.1 YibE/F family protein [Periweissella fabalis]